MKNSGRVGFRARKQYHPRSLSINNNRPRKRQDSTCPLLILRERSHACALEAKVLKDSHLAFKLTRMEDRDRRAPQAALSITSSSDCMTKCTTKGLTCTI